MKKLTKLEDAVNAIEEKIKSAKAECGTEDRLQHSYVYILGMLAAMEGSIKSMKDFLNSLAAQANSKKKSNKDGEIPEE